MKRKIKERQAARKFLADVPPEHVFRCKDGKVLRNVKELGDALSVMSKETYGYHWNAGKNDFSNWVRDIIGDVKLAKELEGATSQSLAAWEVATRLAYLARWRP
ncbi:MAG: hypothetical protein ABIH70_03540 [Chloroflexota bacterium]